jgi:hypothetical protein
MLKIGFVCKTYSKHKLVKTSQRASFPLPWKPEAYNVLKILVKKMHTIVLFCILRQWKKFHTHTLTEHKQKKVFDLSVII